MVVVALGANDGLRGLPVEQMRQNLGRIVEHSRKTGARVLILGMKMPPNYGPAYSRQFEGTFESVSRKYQSNLEPFFLEDFADQPDFFLPDRIHPAENAQPLILERVWKALRPLLR